MAKKDEEIKIEITESRDPKGKKETKELINDLETLGKKAKKSVKHLGADLLGTKATDKSFDKIGESLARAKIRREREFAEMQKIAAKGYVAPADREAATVSEMRARASSTSGLEMAMRKLSQSYDLTGRSSKIVKQHTDEMAAGFQKVGVNVKNFYPLVEQFSSVWGVSMKDAEAHVRKTFTETTKKTDEVGKGFNKLGYSITFVAWHFRYLGNIFENVGQQFIRIITDWIKTGVELQESFFAIGAAARIYGQEAEEAIAISERLGMTGLVPLTAAASATRNLMMTGLGLDVVEDMMYRYLDVASVTTSGISDMNKSLELFSTSVVRGTLLLATDRAARLVWAITNKKVTDELGVNLTKLTMQQRALEINKTLVKEFSGVLGLHKAEMSLISATITRAVTAYELLKYTLAVSLWPVIDLVSRAIIKATEVIRAVVISLGPLLPAFMVVNLAVIMISAKLAFLIGVILSYVKIIDFVKRSLRDLSIAHIQAGTAASLQAASVRTAAGAYRLLAIAMRYVAPILLLLDVLLIAVTWGIMKKTKALDAAANSTKKLTEEFEALEKKFGTGEEAFGESAEASKKADEDKVISHKRAIEDIEEDLARERSKGLWADQIAIAANEKKLNRENEDFTRYLAKNATLNATGAKKEETALEKKVKEFETSMKKIRTSIDETTAAMSWGWYTLVDDLTSEEFWQTWWDKVPGKIINTFKELPGQIYAILVETDWIKIGTKIGTWIGNSLTAGVKVVWKLAKVINSWLVETDWIGIGTKIGTWIVKFITETDWLQVGKDIGRFILNGIQAIFDLKNAIKDIIVSAILVVDWLQVGKDIGKMMLEGWKVGFDLVAALYDKIKPPPLISPEKLPSLQFDWNRLLNPWNLNFQRFQTGGTIPGPIGRPQLAMVHGGETIIPSNRSIGNAITININNPIVRTQEDITSIARAVSQVMGQRQRWERMGA